MLFRSVEEVEEISSFPGHAGIPRTAPVGNPGVSCGLCAGPRGADVQLSGPNEPETAIYQASWAPL